MADLGPGRIAVDTAAFIYYIEEDARFMPLLEPLFAAVAGGERQIVTSALTILEVLVVPYRADDAQLADRYESLLSHSRGVTVIDLSRDQLRIAARLRADSGMKTPDALQVAAALGAGCRCFVTNDRRIPPVRGLRTLQLCDYAG
jgi:predicted nucleic acid-binding protein